MKIQPFTRIFLAEYIGINVPSALEGTIDITKVELSLFSLFAVNVSLTDPIILRLALRECN